MMLRTNPRGTTPDSHDFATRPYDLVKEFVVALVVVALATVVLAAVFSSPDERAVSLRSWAQADPADVVATAAGELAGTTTSATYGPPYDSASQGQRLGPLLLQKWAGAQLPVDSAQDLVVRPLTDSASASGDPTLTTALRTWRGAPAQQRTTWATAYADALAKAPQGDPERVAAGSFGPVPVMVTRLYDLARTGGLEQMISAESFYSGDQTRPLLLLNDGGYVEAQARARSLGGDQWG